MSTYIAGSLVTVATFSGDVSSPTGGFRNRSGALADPDAVKLRYRTPDGAPHEISYPAAPIVRDGAGLYRADLDTTGQPGSWAYEWLSPTDDPVQAIAAGAFTVVPAPV